MNNADLYQRITDKIIAQLEKGVAPWQQPWATVGGGMPSNVVSRKPYRGINIMLLWATAEENGYESNLWATYRQWDMLGGHVNRGEHGTKIIFWNVTTEAVFDKDTGEEQEEKRFFLREYTVFNLAQCGGEALDRFRIARPVREFIDYGPAENAIAATGANIRHGGNRAFFDTVNDYIQLPVKTAFDGEAAYYATALHELAHWSGHASRLNRIDKLARFGDKSYSVEELVAELAGAFLTAALGVPNERTLANATAYLAGWLKILKSDKKAIFTAATAASAAADYVLNFSPVAVPEEVPEEIPF
jgi:antirestriction protein ArdC